MTILITRPEPEAAALATTLNNQGYQTLIDSMLKIHYLSLGPIDLQSTQALIFTSVNAVRSLENNPIDTSLPIYVVGSATAEAAQKAGFQNIHTCTGGALELCKRIETDLDPAHGSLLNLSGKHTVVDVQHILKTKGFEVEKQIVYQAKAADQFKQETLQAFDRGRIQTVLFFSPRTAEIFAKLLKDNKRTRICELMTALCFSQNIADALGDTLWKERRVAQRPEMDFLLSLLPLQESA